MNNVAKRTEARPDDFDDRVKASVKSLRDLIIIFTGLTITASFTMFVHDHFMADDRTGLVATINFDWQTAPREILLLLLLLLCVMRFYHGNIMILDRYYLLPNKIPQLGRSYARDSIYITIMTLGLAILGLVIKYPPLFFAVYAFITLASVFWIRGNSDEFFWGKKSKEYPDYLRDEKIAEGRWGRTNFLFLIAMTMMLVVWAIQSKVETGKGVGLLPNSVAFFSLCALCYMNSFYDLWKNSTEYFPRRGVHEAASA